MQGFNMGRYRPYDHDPQKGSFNSISGKHPLGDRARKLDQGILIVRFELPFNIWCGSCDSHIGQGVRYNAEKKKVGNYYSTPIWSFRCKCHICQNWFEIRTDPKNTRYVVESGARQKHEEWDPAENGGYAIRDEAGPSGTAQPSDPFSVLEKRTTDKVRATAEAERLYDLEELSAARWSDPYDLNVKLRKSFRATKKEDQARKARDDTVRARIGWADDRQLVGEDAVGKEEAKRTWEAARGEYIEESEKRRRTGGDSLALLDDTKRVTSRSTGSSDAPAALSSKAPKLRSTHTPSRSHVNPSRHSITPHSKSRVSISAPSPSSSGPRSSHTRAQPKSMATSAVQSQGARALAARLQKNTARRNDPFFDQLRSSLSSSTDSPHRRP